MKINDDIQKVEIGDEVFIVSNYKGEQSDRRTYPTIHIVTAVRDMVDINGRAFPDTNGQSIKTNHEEIWTDIGWFRKVRSNGKY